MNTVHLGAMLIALSSLFYASYGVWTVLMGDSFGGYTASALRSVIVVCILIGVSVVARKLEPIDWKSNGMKIIGMICASTLVWGPLYWAILKVGIGMVLAINYFAIVVGMLFFGYLFAGEKITKTKMLATLMGMCGLLLVFMPVMQGAVAILPMLAAVVSGLAIGATTVWTKQLTYNATQSALILWATSVVANIPGALILGENLPPIGLDVEWLYLMLFAVSSVLSSWLLIAGLKYTEAGWAGILGLLEIVFAVLLGYIFFHEQIGVIPLIGIGVIMLASVIPFLVKTN